MCDMTEKRFTVHIDWFNYEKTKGEATLKDNGQPLICSECVEDVRTLNLLLNEQHEEIQQLKSERDFYKEHCESEGLLYD